MPGDWAVSVTKAAPAMASAPRTASRRAAARGWLVVVIECGPWLPGNPEPHSTSRRLLRSCDLAILRSCEVRSAECDGRRRPADGGDGPPSDRVIARSQDAKMALGRDRLERQREPDLVAHQETARFEGGV